MDLKKIILPLAGIGIVALVLSRLKVSPGGQGLPGVTFPEPGTVGVVTGPADEILAENYLIGTAQQAWENAQQIRAEHAVSLPMTYQEIQAFNVVPGRYSADYTLPGRRLIINEEFVSVEEADPRYAGYNVITGQYDPEGWQSIFITNIWSNPDIARYLREFGAM